MRNSELASPCRHCGADTPLPDGFCCHGCAAVYRILHAKGLEHFYALRAPIGEKPRPTPPEPDSKSSQFRWWDSPLFRSHYVRGASLPTGEKVAHLSIYLEGIHCLGCLWLIESLPRWKPGVVSARLDLGHSVARLVASEELSLSSLAADLAAFGYRPHPVATDEERTEVRAKAERRELVRLGISGACAGNVMLLTIPLYAGVQGALATFFRWSSAIVFLPVLAYGLRPFARTAIRGLERWQLSIDLPIVA